MGIGSKGGTAGIGTGRGTREGGCFFSEACSFRVLKEGTGGSALCTCGIGKSGGDISVAHNDPNDSLKINPDLRSPLSCTIGRFFKIKSWAGLILRIIHFVELTFFGTFSDALHILLIIHHSCLVYHFWFL